MLSSLRYLFFQSAGRLEWISCLLSATILNMTKCTSLSPAASLTARERDDVQGGATACPAQVGQISMKLTSSLEYAKRD
jgi:hypothetical protein